MLISLMQYRHGWQSKPLDLQSKLDIKLGYISKCSMSDGVMCMYMCVHVCMCAHVCRSCLKEAQSQREERDFNQNILLSIKENFKEKE